MECSGCQSQNAPDATFCTQCGKALGEQPMSSTPQTASEEWSRHWPLVLAGLVGMSFLTAISTSLGMFMEPLQHDFGWSREESVPGRPMIVFAHDVVLIFCEMSTRSMFEQSLTVAAIISEVSPGRTARTSSELELNKNSRKLATVQFLIFS